MKLIFDCDNTLGIWNKDIDDGLVLLYLLGREDVDLLGVTTTFGNSTIEDVDRRTRDLAAKLGQDQLPVARGAGCRGQCGMPAANLLVETADQYPGELVILATGPLGNLRAAHEIDNDFFDKVKQIACMGGYLEPVRMGRRDVRELNLSADPEASHLVLNAPCPVALLSAQICLQAPFFWRDFPRLRFWSPGFRWNIVRWLTLHAVFTGLNHFYLWDLVPAVYLTCPEIFSGPTVRMKSTVQDLENGDLIPESGLPGNQIYLPDQILDYGKFMQYLIDAWSRVKI